MPVHADWHQVITAMRQNRVIEAVKWIRTITGLDLKEAKDIYEVFLPHIKATRAIDECIRPVPPEAYNFAVLKRDAYDGGNYYCAALDVNKEQALAEGRQYKYDDVLVVQIVARTRRVLVEEGEEHNG